MHIIFTTYPRTSHSRLHQWKITVNDRFHVTVWIALLCGKQWGFITWPDNLYCLSPPPPTAIKPENAFTNRFGTASENFDRVRLPCSRSNFASFARVCDQSSYEVDNSQLTFRHIVTKCVVQKFGTTRVLLARVSLVVSPSKQDGCVA